MIHSDKPKTVFITGAGSGIGRALAIAFAARGYIVCVTDLDLVAAQAVASLCGVQAQALALDVRDANAVKSAVDDFVKKTGRLDYMVNNAGIGIAGETDEIGLNAWQHIIDINLYGVLHGVLAAYPVMLQQQSGHILNVASLAGLGPAPLFSPYALTKHAVVGLSTSLRIEAAARKVNVSVLCPAAIETALLNKDNPSELQIPWAPDARRFLTALAGPPYSVEKCAQETLLALDRNLGVIVLPGRARLAWRLGRLLPSLVEALGKKEVAKERAFRS